MKKIQLSPEAQPHPTNKQKINKLKKATRKATTKGATQKKPLQPLDNIETTYHSMPAINIGIRRTNLALVQDPLRERDPGQKYYKSLAQELIDWANCDPNAFKLSQFYRAYGIGKSCFYGWVNKSPELKTALEIAKQALGDRREMGAALGVLNPVMIKASMSMYDEDWKKDEDRKALLAKQELAPPDITINVPNLLEIESSDEENLSVSDSDICEG